MEATKLKRAAIGAALVACGYAVGAVTPVALAYTQDETRLMNRISNDLSSINKSLSKIASRIK